ncbi:MAG: hypothetical protein ABFS23_09010 [Pseudomonadota bacterium]
MKNWLMAAILLTATLSVAAQPPRLISAETSAGLDQTCKAVYAALEEIIADAIHKGVAEAGSP